MREPVRAREQGRVLAERYRLLERIDEGGAGEVWLARDERLGREVAVKLLGAGADPAFRERFTEEARRAAVISHPNVVAVFDEGQDGPDAFMVMEHVRGRTLREVIADRGALTPIEAAPIVAQVAEALDAAHAAGVIHCDVKPANVILDERGTAKLTDFGVARAARGPAEHELIATPRYIAPERIEGRPPTSASDVYGLGLVAYELLAGRPPFEGMDTDDLLRERLEVPPPSLRKARVGIAPEIDLVVARALARQPRRRYASAGAFARDLLAATRGERTRTMPMLPPLLRPLRRERGGPRPDTDVAAVSDRGRVREGNQDRYLAKRSGAVTLLAVADGVGGEAGGDVASAAAVEALASAFEFTSRDSAAALASAIRAANDAVLRATSDSGHRLAASTLVAATVRGRQLAVANLGDSRAYLVRDGSARQITADHSGELPNSITRFVGDPRGVAPDVFVEVVRPRDRLVLCSDGLTKHVQPEEIAAMAGGSPERAARALVDLANERGGIDNVTVVIYRSPPPLAQTAALLVVVVTLLLALAASAAGLLVPAATPSPSPAPSPSASP